MRRELRADHQEPVRHSLLEEDSHRSIAEETIMEDRIVRRWGGISTDVKFALPPDALPTLNGTLVQKIQPGIAWAVTAFLDVTKARDMRQRQEFTVVRPPALEDSPPQPTEAASKHSQCDLALSLSRSRARSGDRIDGSFRAEMLDEVSASEVRVELVRVEKLGNESQDHSVDVVALEQDETLRPGETREWDFQLDVGHVSVPSLEDREVVGPMVGEGNSGQKDAARPAGGAGDQRRFLTMGRDLRRTAPYSRCGSGISLTP